MAQTDRHGWDQGRRLQSLLLPRKTRQGEGGKGDKKRETDHAGTLTRDSRNKAREKGISGARESRSSFHAYLPSKSTQKKKAKPVKKSTDSDFLTNTFSRRWDGDLTAYSDLTMLSEMSGWLLPDDRDRYREEKDEKAKWRNWMV